MRGVAPGLRRRLTHLTVGEAVPVTRVAQDALWDAELVPDRVHDAPQTTDLLRDLHADRKRAFSHRQIK